MKVGIKRIHENEWAVHVGCATIKMDLFSVQLLNISLEHLLALQDGEEHSLLKSYIQLGARIKELNPAGIQKLVRAVDNRDLLKLLMASNDGELSLLVLQNLGGILAKQLQADMERSPKPDVEESKQAIKRVVETMFEMEGNGEIEFFNDDTKYI